MPGLLAFIVTTLILAAIYAVASLGLNTQWGYTGLFNIGVAAFMGVGAYTFAILTTEPTGPGAIIPHLGGFGLPFWVGLLGAIGVSGLLGYLIALPTLRLRADYLAIATLGLAEIIRIYIENARTITAGTQPLRGVPRPERDLASFIEWLTGVQVSFGPNLSDLILFAVVIASMLAVYLLIERSVRSPWGRILKGIREDEDATQALGKNTFRYKVQSFVLGSMIMGAAGGLLAVFFRVISTANFLPIDTFIIWIMLIVGGSGNNKGAVLGAFLIWGVFSFSRLATAHLPDFIAGNFAQIRLIAVGLLLILLMMYRPQGILGEEKMISKMG